MKRLLVALSAVGLGVLMAVPAMAQTSGDQYGKGGSVTLTGVLQKQGITSYQYGTHFMKDAGSGTGYALKSGKVDLNGYVGKRVTVHGTVALRAGELEGGPALVDVSRVTPVSSSPGDGGSTNVEPDGPAVTGSGSGSGGSDTGSGSSGARGGGTSVLPSTGGVPLSVVAGAALLASGVLIRRAAR